MVTKAQLREICRAIKDPGIDIYLVPSEYTFPYLHAQVILKLGHRFDEDQLYSVIRDIGVCRVLIEKGILLHTCIGKVKQDDIAKKLSELWASDSALGIEERAEALADKYSRWIESFQIEAKQ